MSKKEKFLSPKEIKEKFGTTEVVGALCIPTTQIRCPECGAVAVSVSISRDRLVCEECGTTFRGVQEFLKSRMSRDFI